MEILKFCFLTGCLSVSSFINAQVAVKGRIADESDKGLAYATVRLLCQDSTFVQGVVTDSIGLYKLENVQKGNYLLSFSSIGYEAKVYPFAVGDTEKVLPVVYLKENSVLLGEVEVKGSSFIRQKDRVLIIPDKQQVKHAFTGYDLLSNLMIPGIDVDRKKGVVATMGGTVTLYIDGRKVDYREVQSLRPRDIEKVEYFDVPTGKYAGDVASINYITRKWKSGGYVSLDANQTIGYLQGDYNAVSKVSHGNTSYTLFAGHTMYDYNEDDNRSTESFVLADRSFTRDEITEADKRKKNQQYAQFNVLNQTGKRTLSAKMSFVHSGMPDNGRRGMLDYSDYYEDVCSSSSTDQKSLAPSLELYGSFRLKDNQRLECSLPVSYTQNTYDRSYQENEYASMTNVDEKLYMLNPSLNYSLSMPHQNTLTVQLMHSHRITSATYAGDNPSWQHLWSGESLLFASYNQRFGKLSMNGRIGMSALQYRLHGHEKTHYISPRGDLSFFYQFSDRQQFGIGAAVGSLSRNQYHQYGGADYRPDTREAGKSLSGQDKDVYGFRFVQFAGRSFQPVRHIHVLFGNQYRSARFLRGRQQAGGIIPERWRLSSVAGRSGFVVEGYGCSPVQIGRTLAVQQDNGTGLAGSEQCVWPTDCELLLEGLFAECVWENSDTFAERRWCVRMAGWQLRSFGQLVSWRLGIGSRYDQSVLHACQDKKFPAFGCVPVRP